MRKIFLTFIISFLFCNIGFAAEYTYAGSAYERYQQAKQQRNQESYGGYQQQSGYSATAQQQQQPDFYSQGESYQGEAKTLKDLPQGTIVIDPTSKWKYNYEVNYAGEQNVEAPVFWRVFANNHFAGNTTLLVSDFLVAKYDFCHRNKGVRSWKDSDARRFLRTTFYKHFSLGFKNAVVDVMTSSVDLNGTPYKISDNVFLLSIVEWGLSDRKNNGTGIDYPYINRDYITGMVRFYQPSNLLILDKNSAMSYWTRTVNSPKAISAGYKKEVFVVKGGILEDTYARYGFMGNLRPAVNIKADTPIKGPFKMKYFVNNTLTYYVLDFPAPVIQN